MGAAASFCITRMGLPQRPIFVTGAAGFIGANFVLEWLGLDLSAVISIDKLTYAGNVANLAKVADDFRHVFIRGDIGDAELIIDLLKQYSPKAIINFAAETHVDRSINAPADFIETNVVGTFRLLEATRSYYDTLATSDKASFRFLHISTDEVFGSLDKNGGAFAETSRYQPNNPYSASKAASDHLMRAWCHTFELPIVITNCSNNYGPYQFPEKLVPLVIHHALAGQSLPIYGDGQQRRDWLYVLDHCDAIRNVLDRGRIGQTYNIGGSNEKTNIQVVQTVCDILDVERQRADGRSYREQIEFVVDRPGHDRRYAIDATKIKTELGWVPRTTFETGLRKTVRWYLDNIAWIKRVIDGPYAK